MLVKRRNYTVRFPIVVCTSLGYTKMDLVFTTLIETKVGGATL